VGSYNAMYIISVIRLDGAIDLAKSIADNKTLTYLDLSYNSLATDGGTKVKSITVDSELTTIQELL